jgi:hypothetical protein
MKKNGNVIFTQTKQFGKLVEWSGGIDQHRDVEV